MASVFAHAQNKTEIKEIHFAEEANWPPFTPNQYGLTQEGLSYILMKNIFSRLEIDISVDLLPQKRMLLYLKQGRKDGATVISKNIQREEYLDFSEPIFQKKGNIYYLKQRHPSIEWNSYADLKGLKIGVVSGHNLGSEFNQAIKEHSLQIYAVTRSKQNFETLLAQRIDILLSIEPTANYFLQQPMFKDKIGRTSKPYYTKDYHIGFAKKSKAKALLPKVNRIIKQMKEDGSLENILSKYDLSF